MNDDFLVNMPHLFSSFLYAEIILPMEVHVDLAPKTCFVNCNIIYLNSDSLFIRFIEMKFI